LGVDRNVAAVVVGAGPAGLATSRELARAGVDHLVLERGEGIGHTWANLYDGLVLHTGKHLSALPGMPFPASTPLFPTRRDFLDYLHRYAETFRLPVETRAEVVGLRRREGLWTVGTVAGAEVRARAVVMATGIVSNPHVADIPHAERFRGRMIHSVAYRRPDGFEGQRVLVVGAGNSAGEISVELARAGAVVTVAVRSGARVVPLQLLGIPIQYLGVALSALPLGIQRRLAEMIARISERVRGPAVFPRPKDTNCPDLPLIGFHLVDAVRAGVIGLKGGIAEFTPAGARFTDGAEEAFDQVILATGYNAALGPLGDLVELDECGFAARRRRVVSVDQPDLYFVGHNYDVRGGLRNIALDARRAAKIITGVRPGSDAGLTPVEPQ
jgi:cation diffusion facilitator CzcD-associated flavoprotein CzcO